MKVTLLDDMFYSSFFGSYVFGVLFYLILRVGLIIILRKLVFRGLESSLFKLMFGSSIWSGRKGLRGG